MGRRPSWARRYVVPVLVASLIASLGTPPLPAVAITVAPSQPVAPALNAEPAPTIVVPFQAPGYRYLVVSPGGGPADFMQPGFNDSAFGTGAGGFGSGGGCAVQGTRQTNWPTNTDILLRKTIDLPPNTTDVTIIGGIDNDLFIYWNGQLLGQRFHEGCPTPTDFTVPVPQTAVVNGNNVLAVRARDRGVESWVDLKVIATLHPLTTPTAAAGPDQSVVEGAIVGLNGTASTDPSGAPLSYSWALAGRTGPPITLSSSTSPTPTFQTFDDGVYRFALTVSNGTASATDEIVVTVTNAVPVLSVQADPAYEKSVALITTTFTDAGILDTHHGVLDWGDGSSPETVPVDAQGSGWGTLVASHVYVHAGSFTVRITVVDDDGGQATTTVGSFSVLVPVAIWANSSNSDAAMESTSGAATFEGLVHTNDDLRIRGGAKSFHGPTEYVRTLDLGGSTATFDPAPVRTAIKPFPLRFDIVDYRPAGRAAVEAGTAYHNMSSSCVNGVWQVIGTTLSSGIYYANCAVKLNGTPLGGTITVAAEGDITVSGSGVFFDPYVDGLLFLSNSTSTSAIRVDAASSTFFGYSFAERGRIVLTGANDKFYCGILADRIDIASQDLLVHGSACSRPARTVAPPTIVPALSIGLTVDKADALPGAGLTHTATVTNTGSTVVVPGILGLENLGTATATVTGHTLALEYLSATDHAWHPLPGTITTNVRPNAFPGVTYPGGANAIDGTTIPAGGLASWGYAAVISLTAADTALLLDPARVSAIRVSSSFTLNPSTVPVRRLFRFGDDFAGQLRALGADATNVAVTIVPPAGDARVFNGTTTPALATLVPGESVAVSHLSTVPVPAPRGATESDAAYLARLTALDRTPLVGTAFARGTAGIGPVLAPAAVATTTRHLPVVALDKTGPVDLEPGSTAAYDLGLSNGGSAEARGIVVADTLAGVGTLPVSGAPATLASMATATAHASYAVPSNITNTTLANTGSVRWADAGGNAYGPVNDSAATRLIAARKLIVTKTDAASTVGGQFVVDYDISITNVGAQTITGIDLTDHLDPYTTLVAGSVRTSQGTVTVGDDPSDVDVAVAVGTLASGGTVSIGFRAALTGSVPEGMNGIANQATVTSDQLDPVPSDDPEGPGATDPTITAVVGTGGGGGGGGELAHPDIGTTSPADGTVITEPTDVSAEITPAEGFTVASWSILLRPAGGGADTILATQTVSGGGVVTASGTVDPTKLPNGTYLLTIRAVSSDGGVQTSTTSLIVDGNLKLGRYVTTYQDLSVGVGGLPMQVLRTYDSFDKTVGDFGVGWNVDLANFRVSVNKPLGYGGWVQETFGCGFIFCQTRYHSTTPHTVTVVWPDGHQEIFDMAPANGSTFFAPLTAAGFTGRARTTSTLQADGDTGLSFFGDGNLYGGGFGSGGVYDPQRFRLTSKDGTVYLLDRTSGLVSATDRNGNTLTVTPNGITSSLGPSITFVRDPQGRITKITGPEDATLLYTYDAAGDLRTVVDPNGRTVTYEYDSAHNLRLTRDPLNRPFQTLTYVDGRLDTVIDALGNDVHVDVDVDARTETVLDPEGRLTTISKFDERGNVTERREIYDGKTAINTFVYDDFDNVESRTDPNGNTWTAVYDERSLRFFTDPTERTIEIRYDDFGYPILWRQSRGGETEYDYDPAGNLERITDPLEHSETATYDAAGNVATRTDREGRVWTYDYFPTGLLESVTDPLDKVTTYTYDDSGRRLTETDATNRTTSYTYWPDGAVKARTMPGGFVTSYTYGALGLLETTTDPAGKVMRWQHDAAGRLQTITDPLGKVTSYRFDRAGRLTSTTAADTGTTTHVLDGFGRLESTIDPVGRATNYEYDLGGRLSTLENPAGGVTEYGYDDAGRKTSEEDPLGRRSTWTHDGDGNVASVTDPALHTTRLEYDLADRLVRMIDARDGITTYGHDRIGRVTTVTNPELETTTTDYDPAGRESRVINNLGHTTTFGYDDAGRVLTVTDALGHATTNTYDPAGRVATATTASGITTTYTYDPRGMVATERNALGHTTTYTYDDAGRLATSRDPRNFTTTYTYDAVGRLKTIRDPKNAVVTLGYNLAGEQTSLTDPLGKAWLSSYDDLGSLASETDPLSNERTWTYDVAGQIDIATDARGIAAEYGFDPAGNLESIEAQALTVTYDYDELNRLTAMSGDLGATSWSYDDAGRVTRVESPAGDVDYGYDDAGRRESMTLPTGVVEYDYFDDGRLSSIQDPSGAYTFSYFADGRLQTLTRPNGVTTTDGYDSAGRLTSVTHRKGAIVVAGFSYMLDPTGNRTSMTTAGATETYTINELNQLTRVDLPGGSTAYTYDAAGNRRTRTAGGVTTTYGYDDASRLTSAGSTTFTYDDEGNRLTGGGSTYTYDALGRMSGVSGGGSTLTYHLDGDGLRAGSTSGGTTRHYLWDRGTAGGPLLDDGAARYLQSGSELLAQAWGGSVTYPLADALGSVRAITDRTGTAIGTAAFDAFGARTSQTGASSAFGFAGSWSDASGLLYMRARSLDPATGIFLSTDPIRPGAPGVVGYDPYSYVGNNPTTWTDPSGMFAMAMNAPIYARMAAAVAAIGTIGKLTALAILRMAFLLTLPAGLVCTAVCDVFVPPWGIGAGTGAGTGAGAISGSQKLIDYLTKLRGLTQAAAEAVVAACARYVALGLIGGPDMCTGERLPIYISGGKDQPVSTFHIGIAALLMGKKLILHQGLNPDAAIGIPHKWYDQVRFQPNACSNRGTDWCDEYPFWSTSEGGTKASLMPVPGKEGQIQGGVLSALYGVCLNGKADKQFLVVPVPLEEVPSAFACVPG